MGAAGVVELAAFPLLLLQLPVVMVRVDVTETMVAKFVRPPPRRAGGAALGEHRPVERGPGAAVLLGNGGRPPHFRSLAFGSMRVPWRVRLAPPPVSRPLWGLAARWHAETAGRCGSPITGKRRRPRDRS